MDNSNIKQIGFWGAIVLGVTALVAGMIWLVNFQKTQPVNDKLTISNPIEATDWVRGNRDAKVVLTEYSDLQCPACGAFSQIVNQIMKDFGNDVAFVYRHFPLPQHANAIPMAYAVEAAGLQGKFWEMSDMIFQNQTSWSSLSDVSKTVSEYAKTLGLDVTKFNSDFTSKSLRDKTDNTIAENQKVDITYTPTFFVNGERIENPRSYAEFKTLIESAINAKR